MISLSNKNKASSITFTVKRVKKNLFKRHINEQFREENTCLFCLLALNACANNKFVPKKQ